MGKHNVPARACARFWMASAAAVVAVTALAGCGADGNDVDALGMVPVAVSNPQTNPQTVTTTGVTVHVIAIDNTFRAQDTKARVGDTVTFTNKGKNDHDVLPQEGNAWGVQIAGFHPGDTYSYVFTEPGVYPFFCSIHGTNQKGMVGTITVTG